MAAAVAAAVSAINCLRFREALGTAMRLRVLEFRGRQVRVDKELKNDDLRIILRSVSTWRLVVVVEAIVVVCECVFFGGLI